MIHFPHNYRTIGLLPASYGLEDSDLKAGCRHLEKLGCRVILPEVELKSCRYLAAGDSVRAAALHSLLNNPDVEMIMAMRGGYGSARILPLVDWDLLKRRNLPIVGHSDLTAFHLAAWKKGMGREIFGPMLRPQFVNEEYLAWEEANISSLVSCLEMSAQVFSPATMNSIKVLKEGRARGPLVPANLTMLLSLLGTPYLPDLSGTILVLEDIGEAAYRIDRGLNQLEQAGILPRLAGLVFGEFTDCENSHFLPEILTEAAAGINGPVVSGLQFGHIPCSCSLPLGALGRLDGDCLEVSPADDRPERC